MGQVLQAVARYVREVRIEATKIVWPTTRQTTTFTIVVIVIVAIVTGLIYGFDELLNLVFRLLVGMP